MALRLFRGGDRTVLVLVAIGVAVIALGYREGNISRQSIELFLLLIPSIILHEVSHGVVALAFGDPTAKDAGRLTLNPIKHVDPFGTIILPAILALSGANAFGYAKPVPVNVRRLRSPRNHSLLVSLAGPATNLALMLLAVLAFKAVGFEGSRRALELLYLLGAANVALAIFNLIPLPPLDGSAVVERLLPTAWWPRYLQLRQYSMLILLGIFLLAPRVLQAVMRPGLEAYDRLIF